jgi:hypothetical protein
MQHTKWKAAMPKVLITDKNFSPLIVSDFSRVPCVGEHIQIDWCDGNGGPQLVEYVSWTVYRNNIKPVEAIVSIGLDDRDGRFAKYFNVDHDDLVE